MSASLKLMEYTRKDIILLVGTTTAVAVFLYFVAFGPADLRAGMFGRTFKGGSKGANVTVWIYVDTSKQVGDRNHLKVFDSQAAAQAWLDVHDPEGVAFKYEVNSMMPAREAYDRFQHEVDHILEVLKRKS